MRAMVTPVDQDLGRSALSKAAGGADLATLRDHLELRGEALGDAAVWYIGHRVAGALAHAHSVTDDEGNPAPAVHLGLRPEDVMIAWDGRVRLINRARKSGDLGASSASTGGEEASSEYMAPEQRGGGRVTHRADVYRLGLLLWSLLTWRRPPADGSRPESLVSARGDIPRAIADVIDAALEPSASRRRITCLEIEQWLATIVDARAASLELRDHLTALRSPKTTPLPAVGEAPPEPEGPPELTLPAPSPSAPPEAPPPPPEAPPTPLAPPRIAPTPPRPGPLSPAAFVSVALATAVFVVVIGIVVAERVSADGARSRSSSLPAPRTPARATTSATTDEAPAPRSAVEHADNVEPVVATSSTSTTERP